MEQKKIKSNSVMRRWLSNSLLIMVLVLIVLGIMAYFGVQSIYYSGIKQTIYTKSNMLLNSVITTADTGLVDVSTQIRALVESFEDRQKMELMAIDGKGKVVMSTQGYRYTEDFKMPDYEEALSSENGTGEYIGPYITGEQVLAVTVLLPVQNRHFSALRFVVSLEKANQQIFSMFMLLICFGIAIITVISVSSITFIKTILRPINRMAVTTKRIAAGDFTARVSNNYDDEIGQLCNSINEMAGELAVTEEMKNEFVSSVSHELRTPLTAIQGWGETLENSVGDEETFRRGMGVINKETKRLSTMVEELLDFSRMQAGNMAMKIDKVDLVAELTDVVIMFTKRAQQENKRITYNEPQDIFVINGDKNRLHQVFINILDNAMKYTGEGGDIAVSVDADENQCTVIVRDSGVGIAAADLPRIKGKFYKGAGAKRGSGIGLAVCDEIVEKHGGQLNIESRVGRGTRVSVTLPIYDGQRKLSEGGAR